MVIHRSSPLFPFLSFLSGTNLLLVSPFPLCPSPSLYLIYLLSWLILLLFGALKGLILIVSNPPVVYINHSLDEGEGRGQIYILEDEYIQGSSAFHSR